MPHANNLDLCVFPAMSRRHTALLSSYTGNKEAPTDDIWKCVEEVWEDLPSAKIARGFMHGYRILEKVVEHRGNNEFLRTKDFHTGVREDYYDTDKGIKKVIKSDL